MWRETIVKYYSKYLILFIILQSLIISILLTIYFEINNILLDDIYGYTLFGFGIISIIFLIVINTKSIEKRLFRNIIISIIIYLHLLIKAFLSFDTLFLKNNYLSHLPFFHSFSLFFYLYDIITRLYIKIPVKIPQIKLSFEISEIIYFVTVMFFVMLIINLIYTFIFKFIKYKNNNKYLILTLCYIQNIILPITFRFIPM
jgi:hypothetical protein